MAYREPLTDIRTLEMFCPSSIVDRVKQAIENGDKVEMECTSFNDPGPDENRVMINDQRIFTIPGY